MRKIAEEHLTAVICTSHVSPATMKVLESENNQEEGQQKFPFLVAPYLEGCVISCLGDELVSTDYHDLDEARAWAKHHGYGYLILDRDADTVDNLIVHDW